MKKAINIGACTDIELYKKLKRAGYDGCDIGLDTALMLEKDWEEKMHAQRKVLDDLGLSCVQVHLPMYDLLLSSEIIDEDVKTAVLRSVKAMQILGCKRGAYHPRTSLTHNYDSEISLRDNHNEISMYLEEAEKYGVGIAIENLAVFPECPQHRFFSSDNEELRALADSFGSDNIGICWDFGHANLMPVSQEKAFELLGDRIKITHIHNNFGFYDNHIMPPLGNISWETLMPALKKCGYNGDFALEIKYFTMTTELESYYRFGYDCLCKLERYFYSES